MRRTHLYTSDASLSSGPEVSYAVKATRTESSLSVKTTRQLTLSRHGMAVEFSNLH